MVVGSGFVVGGRMVPFVIALGVGGCSIMSCSWGTGAVSLAQLGMMLELWGTVGDKLGCKVVAQSSSHLSI